MAQRPTRRWVFEESKKRPCEKCGKKSSGRMRENGVQMWLCIECGHKLFLAHSKIRKQVTDTTRQAVYTRDGRKCVKCGAVKNLTIDHIKPIALGGDSSIDNLQTMCQRCNYGKADRRIGI